MGRSLTPEERDARHEAKLERNRAWRARRRTFTDVEACGNRDLDNQFGRRLEILAKEREAIEAEWNSVLDVHARNLKEVEDKFIREKQRMQAKRADHQARFGALVDEKRGAENRLHARLSLEFPDMDGAARWSAASWNPTGGQPS